MSDRHNAQTQQLGSEADAVVYLVGEIARATDQAFLGEFTEVTGGRSRRSTRSECWPRSTCTRRFFRGGTNWPTSSASSSRTPFKRSFPDEAMRCALATVVVLFATVAQGAADAPKVSGTLDGKQVKFTEEGLADGTRSAVGLLQSCHDE